MEWRFSDSESKTHPQDSSQRSTLTVHDAKKSLSECYALLVVFVVAIPAAVLLVEWIVSFAGQAASLVFHVAMVIVFSWIFALRVVDLRSLNSLRGILVAGISLPSAVGVGDSTAVFRQGTCSDNLASENSVVVI